MEYFKANDIVKTHKVGKRTVYHWIESAKEGKVDLDLVNVGTKTFISNTHKNLLLLKQLASNGKKFKNRKSLKLIKPKEDFYKVFDKDQIIDIIKNLEVNREIPLKYAYMNGGADSWDQYISEVWKKEKTAVIPNTLELLNFDTHYIYSLISKYNKINLIDIGPGNALPVKKFIEFLISKNILKKYIAIDYSPQMLKIAEENLKNWFGEEFNFEGHQADITSDTFQSLLFENSEFNGEEVTCANLILYIGGTIENDRLYDQQLRIINYSMGKSDTFVLEQGLDTESVKLRLTFGNQEKSSKNADLKHRKMVLDLLNIPDDYYEVERFYDETLKAKLIKIKFKIDLKIQIETETFKKTLSFMSKETLTIWRYNSHTKMEVIDEMSKAGFDIKHVSTSMNNESIMLVSQIKSLNS